MKKFVYFVLFVAFFDMFAQLPIISPLAKQLGATPFVTSLSIALYSATNLIGNITSGISSDRIGARPIILVGLTMTALIQWGYFAVHSPETLLVVRIIHGFAAGLLVPAAFSLLASEASYSRKGKAMALSGAIVGSAAVVGPAFGGIIAKKLDYMAVFMSSAILLGIALILAYFFVHNKQSTTKTSGRIATTELLRDKFLLVSYLGAFSLMFSQGVLAYMLPLKALALGGDSRLSGTLLSTFGIVAILFFLLPTNRLFDAKPAPQLIRFGLIGMAVATLLISVLPSSSSLYGAMVVYGIGFALLFPSLNTLLVQHAPIAVRGQAFGMFYSFFSLGTIVGSGLTGVLELGANDSFRLTAALLATMMIFSYLYLRKGTAH